MLGNQSCYAGELVTPPSFSEGDMHDNRVYDVYKHLGLDDYNVDFMWFSRLIRSMIMNIYHHGKNPFVHPKYFCYDWLTYMFSYYDHPKHKRFIIDYFHKPEKVLEIFGPFHPLIYGDFITIQSYLAKQFYVIDNDYFVNFDDLLDATNKLIQFLHHILDYPKEYSLNYDYVDEYDMFRFSFDFPYFSELKQFATLFEPASNLYPRLVFTAKVKYDSYCLSDGFFVYYVKQHPIQMSFDDIIRGNEDLHRIQHFLINIDSYEEVMFDESLLPFKDFFIVDREQRRAFKIITRNSTIKIQPISFDLIAYKVLETVV